ncbi:MAG: GAF domain-containing protein [Chloroflexi bacterium]|nr:MAG: GAF domain-containing protein [Chloroflexota bacterium]
MPATLPQTDVLASDPVVRGNHEARPATDDTTESEGKPDQQQALHEAALKLIAELSLPRVLQTATDLARQVAGARYAALGLPDGEGGLAEFIVSGLTEEQIRAIGSPPRGRGILGILLNDPRALRLANLQQDPRSVGFPPHHPPMSSFLGVPVQHQGQVLGYLYLTDKADAPEFSAEDEILIQRLADYVAVAIENARRYQRERRRRQQQQLISEISRKISSALDPDAVLGYAARLIRETFGYYAVNIGLVEGEELVFRTGLWGPAVKVDRHLHLRIGHEGITGWVAANAQPLLVPDVRAEPRYHPVEELPHTRSELAVPICWGNQVLGVLDVQSDRPNGLDEEDLVLLESLTPHIALAIQNARLFAAQEQEVDSLATLLRVSQTISSLMPLQEIMAAIGEVARQAIGTPRVGLFLWREENGQLVPEQAYTTTEVGIALFRTLRGSWADFPRLSSLKQKDRPVAIEDVEKLPANQRAMGEQFGVRSVLAAPVTGQGKWFGLLALADTRPRAFNQREISLVEIIARQAAVAIDNARLYKQAEQERDRQAMLLQEVRHRVKNNLQTMVGFLSYVMAHRHEVDLAEAVPAVIERIKAMAKIQDTLSAHSAEPVEFRDLVAKAVEPALIVPREPDKSPALEFRGPRLLLTQVAAEALALAVNELVLNALEHGQATKITIRTKLQAGRVTVEVVDNGIGLPEGFDLSRDAGLGLSIADGLVRRSLGGSLSLTRSRNRTIATINLPADVLAG